MSSGKAWSEDENRLLWQLYIVEQLSAPEVSARLQAQLGVSRSVKAVYRRADQLRERWADAAAEQQAWGEVPAQQTLGHQWRRKEAGQYKRRALKTAAIAQLVDAVQAAPRVEFPPPLGVDKPHAQFPPETAALLFSDLHIGSLIMEHEAGGAVYNYEIFRARLDFLLRKLLLIGARYPADFTSLVVMGLGDYLDGMGIFEGQSTCLETRLQFVAGLYDISNFFRQLLVVFPKIHVVSVSGNHSRGSGERNQNQDKDFDYLLMTAVAASLSEYSDRITFDLPLAASAKLDIRGHRFHIEHGHNLSTTSLQTIQTSVLKIRAMEPFEYFCMGHTHNPNLIHMRNSVGGGKILINASFAGASDLAYNKIRDAAEASQWFFGVNEEFGMTFAYDLRLDEQRQDKSRFTHSIW